MERVVIFLVFAVYTYMYIDDLTLYMNAHVETRGLELAIYRLFAMSSINSLLQEHER